MIELGSLLEHAAAAWKALPLGPFERSCVRALAIGGCFYFLIYLIERAYGTRTDNYQSRMFGHDTVYWLYYATGLNRLLFLGPFFALLEQPLSILDVKLLTSLPFALQVALFFVISDFIGYWIHRAEHHFKFMWAFHTTHHSQERLTFATTGRFHPVEHFYQDCLTYIPLRILGVDPMSWILVNFVISFNTATQHTQIPWRLGPFYKILATPTFHSFHHSIDPAHHNKNFGGVFSLWDYLFGTAVSKDDPPPSRFGLDFTKPTSLWSTLVTPFRLLYEFYFAGQRRTSTDSR